jgi:hypothetical protein
MALALELLFHSIDLAEKLRDKRKWEEIILSTDIIEDALCNLKYLDPVYVPDHLSMLESKLSSLCTKHWGLEKVKVEKSCSVVPGHVLISAVKSP